LGADSLRVSTRLRTIQYYLERKTSRTLFRDPTFPDSLKARLELINEIRKYAIDSLGLKDTENYKTLYDQKGEEVMWVVMASEPFALKPKEWTFPVVRISSL
jgi:predicted aminopeptidase